MGSLGLGGGLRVRASGGHVRVGHPLLDFDLEGERWVAQGFFVAERIEDQSVIESHDAVFVRGCRVDYGKFYDVGLNGNRGSFPFVEADALFALAVPEDELTEHQESDSKVDQDIAASGSEQEDQTGEHDQADKKTFCQLPNDP